MYTALLAPRARERRLVWIAECAIGVQEHGGEGGDSGSESEERGEEHAERRGSWRYWKDGQDGWEWVRAG